ncbi:unnamed protein product [Linum tenue]|uniref:Pectinesterase inhibitor domain-containing protein n=1 Tax=Linum tenue TaxID=586396 RepID=A0AAV0MNY4_9ROSI|nr:unnamed protein product [Linum tenue]
MVTWVEVVVLVVLFLAASGRGAVRDDIVLKHCDLTRYPERCRQVLMGFNETNLVVDERRDQANSAVAVLSALLRRTISETNNLPSSHFTVLDSGLEISQARRAQAASEYCKELTGMSLQRLNQSLSALQNSPTKRKHDIQTWLSSVLTFHEACADSIRHHSLSAADVASDHISGKMNYLSQLTSNALSLANRITSTDKKSRGHVAGFPQWVSMKNRKLLQGGGGGGGVRADAVVAKDGTGNYETISAAIAAASGRSRFVIYVKAGIYEEKIRTNKDEITLVGDGKYATVIVGGDSVNGGSTMPGSATFSNHRRRIHRKRHRLPKHGGARRRTGGGTLRRIRPLRLLPVQHHRPPGHPLRPRPPPVLPRVRRLRHHRLHLRQRRRRLPELQPPPPPAPAGELRRRLRQRQDGPGPDDRVLAPGQPDLGRAGSGRVRVLLGPALEAVLEGGGDGVQHRRHRFVQGLGRVARSRVVLQNALLRRVLEQRARCGHLGPGQVGRISCDGPSGSCQIYGRQFHCRELLVAFNWGDFRCGTLVNAYLIQS